MRLNLFMLLYSMSFLSFSAFAEQAGQATVGDLSHVRSIVIDRGITEAGKECINCHQKHTLGFSMTGKTAVMPMSGFPASTVIP